MTYLAPLVALGALHPLLGGLLLKLLHGTGERLAGWQRNVIFVLIIFLCPIIF